MAVSSDDHSVAGGKPWPPLRQEERAWVPKVSAELVSRAVRSRHCGPYRAAVVPSIADARPRLPHEVIALEAEATAEIARFDAEVGADVAPVPAPSAPRARAT